MIKYLDTTNTTSIDLNLVIMLKMHAAYWGVKSNFNILSSIKSMLINIVKCKS